MVWDGKPRTSGKKGIAGSEWETPRTSPKKRMAGSGNTAEEARAQSPKSNLSIGGRYKRVNPGLGGSHHEFLHYPDQ